MQHGGGRAGHFSNHTRTDTMLGLHYAKYVQVIQLSDLITFVRIVAVWYAEG